MCAPSSLDLSRVRNYSVHHIRIVLKGSGLTSCPLQSAQVERLIEMGADATACDKRRVSALHYACGQGRLEVVRFLWSRGVELDAEDPGTSQNLSPHRHLYIHPFLVNPNP